MVRWGAPTQTPKKRALTQTAGHLPTKSSCHRFAWLPTDSLVQIDIMQVPHSATHQCIVGRSAQHNKVVWCQWCSFGLIHPFRIGECVYHGIAVCCIVYSSTPHSRSGECGKCTQLYINLPNSVYCAGLDEKRKIKAYAAEQGGAFARPCARTRGKGYLPVV